MTAITSNVSPLGVLTTKTNKYSKYNQSQYTNITYIAIIFAIIVALATFLINYSQYNKEATIIDNDGKFTREYLSNSFIPNMKKNSMFGENSATKISNINLGMGASLIIDIELPISITKENFNRDMYEHNLCMGLKRHSSYKNTLKRINYVDYNFYSHYGRPIASIKITEDICNRI